MNEGAAAALVFGLSVWVMFIIIRVLNHLGV